MHLTYLTGKDDKAEVPAGDDSAGAGASDKIEITENMASAGQREMMTIALAVTDGLMDCREASARIYRAMYLASRTDRTDRPERLSAQ